MRRRLLARVLMLALSGTAAFARPLPFEHSPAGYSPATPIAPIPEVDPHRCCHLSAAPSLEIAPSCCAGKDAKDAATCCSGKEGKSCSKDDKASAACCAGGKSGEGHAMACCADEDGKKATHDCCGGKQCGKPDHHDHETAGN